MADERSERADLTLVVDFKINGGEKLQSGTGKYLNETLLALSRKIRLEPKFNETVIEKSLSKAISKAVEKIEPIKVPIVWSDVASSKEMEEKVREKVESRKEKITQEKGADGVARILSNEAYNRVLMGTNLSKIEKATYDLAKGIQDFVNIVANKDIAQSKKSPDSVSKSSSSEGGSKGESTNSFLEAGEKVKQKEEEHRQVIATNVALIRGLLDTINKNGIKIAEVTLNNSDENKTKNKKSESSSEKSSKSVSKSESTDGLDFNTLKNSIVSALKSSFSELVSIYRDNVQTISKLVCGAPEATVTNKSENRSGETKSAKQKVTESGVVQSSNGSGQIAVEDITKNAGDAISKIINGKIAKPLSEAVVKINECQDNLNQSIQELANSASSLGYSHDALVQLVHTAQDLSDTSLAVLNTTIENANKITDTFSDIKLEATLSEGAIKDLISEISKNNNVSEVHSSDEPVKKSRYDPGKYALSKQAYQEYVSAMKESFSLLRESLNYSPDSQAYNALVKASESKSFLANGILGRISREGLKDNRLYEKAKREIDVIRAKYETEQEQVGDNRTLNIGDMASSVGESNNLLGAISQCLEEIKTQISSKDFIVSVSKEDIKGMVSELAKERSAQAEKKQKEKVQKTAVVQTNAKQNK